MLLITLAAMICIGCGEIIIDENTVIRKQHFVAQVNYTETSTPIFDPNKEPSHTSTPNPSEFFECLNMENVENIFDLSINDMLIFEGSYHDEYGFYSAESRQDTWQTYLEGFDPLSLYNKHISPDHEWISFTNVRQADSGDYVRDLVIANAAQHYQIYPELLTNQNVGRWLTDEMLILHPFDAPLGTVELFNPFDGQQKELSHPFDEIYSGQTRNWNSAKIVYHPSLNYAAYLHDDPDFTFYKIELYDIRKKQAIWSVGRRQVTMREPGWTFDDKLVVIVPTEAYDGTLEILLVGLEGNAEILYQFMGTLETRLAVSPTSAYFTFFARAEKNSKHKWVIYDFNYRKATDLCIFDEPVTTIGPIWSPDGEQFIAIIWKESTGYDPDLSHVFIFDAKNDRMIEVDVDMFPSAWLKR